MTQSDYFALGCETFAPYNLEISDPPHAVCYGDDGDDGLISLNTTTGQWLMWHDGKIIYAGPIEELHPIRKELAGNGNSDYRAAISEWNCRAVAKLEAQEAEKEEEEEEWFRLPHRFNNGRFSEILTKRNQRARSDEELGPPSDPAQPLDSKASISEVTDHSCKPDRDEADDTPYAQSIKFLQKLRPDGPWLLVAIDPDSGSIVAKTVRSPEAAEAFARKWNGKRNLYYSVNPTRTPLNKKAAKTDIEAIEYALADLDPNDGETSEAAKARYLKVLEHFEPKPTALIDSGNGLQGLWRMLERIALGELKNGKFTRADQDTIADVEVRVAAIMLRLGAKPGTQNIDRILRLPGTINLPNAKKRKEGRTECLAKLLWFNDVSYPLDAFPSTALTHLGRIETGTSEAFTVADLPFEDLGEGLGKPPDESGSGYGFRFMRDCRAQGMNYEQARTAILADKNKAGEWANRVDERQLQRAWEHSKLKTKPDSSGDPEADAEITRLAALSAVKYERERKAAAKKLGLRTETLDKLVINERAKQARTKAPPQGQAAKTETERLLAELNRDNSVVLDGARTRVLRFEEVEHDAGGEHYIYRVPTFLRFEDFRYLHLNRHLMVGDRSGDRSVDVGSWWLHHAQRQQYPGIIFKPNGEHIINGKLNLWRGWGVTPRRGDWGLLREHIYEVLAARDDDVLHHQLAGLGRAACG